MTQANVDFSQIKLASRLITEPNSLWSRVLRYKYYKRRCDLDMFLPKSGASETLGKVYQLVPLLFDKAPELV